MGLWSGSAVALSEGGHRGETVKGSNECHFVSLNVNFTELVKNEVDSFLTNPLEADFLVSQQNKGGTMVRQAHHKLANRPLRGTVFCWKRRG